MSKNKLIKNRQFHCYERPSYNNSRAILIFSLQLEKNQNIANDLTLMNHRFSSSLQDYKYALEPYHYLALFATY